MSEAQDFLKRLRRGPVTHQDAAKRYGPYALGAYKRVLASEGHLIATSYPASGTEYRLVKDAEADRLWEGGTAA
jgi:hypothetical protein